MSFFKKALGTVAKFGGPIGTALGGPMGGMIGGALGSAVGGKLSSDAYKKANRQASTAAAFNPWDASNPMGSVGFADGNINMQFNEGQQGQWDQLGGMFGNQMMGGQNAGFQNFAGGVGNNQMPQLWNQFLGASGQIPNQAFGMFGNQMQNYGGMAEAGAMSGLGQAFGPGMNQGLSQNMFNQGMGMVGQNFDALAAERTNLLRQQAAPFEEQARNAMFQDLFSKGQMGGKAGANSMEQFGNALTQADLGRQMAGQDLAMNMYGQNNQAGLGMLGMGFQGQQNDLNRNLGMGSLGQGMLGAAGQFAGQGLDASVGQSNLVNQRATQRLGEASQMMFGGQTMQNQQFMNALNMLQGQGGMMGQLGNMATLGANVGGQGADAGANQARYLSKNNTSNTGSFLSNVGGQLLDKGMAHFLPKIFPSGP